MSELVTRSRTPAKPWFRRSVAVSVLLVVCLAGPWLIATVLAAPDLAPTHTDQPNGERQTLPTVLPVVLKGTISAASAPELLKNAQACVPTPGNLLDNPSFEQGTAPWAFYTDGTGGFTTGSPASDCSLAARLAFATIGNNMQLYQSGLALKPNTRYRLSFAAYSTTGHDLLVYLQKHTSPYTNYGLSAAKFDLSNAWQQHSIEFVSAGSGSAVSDGRLRFGFANQAQAGDIYWLDNIVLVEVAGGPSATSTPTRTPSPNPTATPTPGSGQELVVYDWNRPVTKADHGFPRDYPPRASANGNWVTPVNYAQGTLYFRAEIRSQPVPQDMRLQICIWQFNFVREMCGPMKQVWGTPGNVVTWSVAISQMYKKNGVSIDWTKPRQTVGVAIKTRTGRPVSDYLGWNWNGQDPNKWYPLNMRFTTVVVAKGATFSGWDKWTGAPADGTQ